MLQRLGSSVIAADAALVRRVAQGDGEAVEALVRAHGNVVFRFVYRRIGGHYDEAQDLTQETFLAALSIASTFDSSCSINTWLCSLAKIKAADYLRRQGRQKRIPASMLVEIDSDGAESLANFRAGQVSVEEVLDRLDAQAFLEGVMAHLSEDELEALLLHYVDGFSVDEMTHLMKRTAKGVESLMTRAKRRCREVAAGWLTR